MQEAATPEVEQPFRRRRRKLGGRGHASVARRGALLESNWLRQAENRSRYADRCMTRWLTRALVGFQYGQPASFLSCGVLLGTLTEARCFPS